VLVSSTEIGQGTNTILAQIAADALGVPYESVDVAQPDTAAVPNSGPTVASRTCMVVGKLVERAALDLRKALRDRDGARKCYAQYEAPPGVYWDDENYRGDAYGAFTWAVYVAEVSVDTATYEARVVDFVAVQEIGRVVHPVLAAGQIEGGVVQGIGYALYENVVWQQGRMGNCQLTNYIIPTAADIPPIRVLFEEKPYAHGPMGAKGIGELPIDGPAPAIASAIENALGVDVTSIPVMPESIMAAMEAVRA
jgi:CO/xanthine dehydrogenase Mo-binding subunit